MSKKNKKVARYYITVDMLREHDACSFNTQLFLETFGPRADVTRENVKKAIAAGLDLRWPAHILALEAPGMSDIEEEAFEVEEQISEERRDGYPDVDRVLDLLNRTGELWERYRREYNKK